MNCLLRLVRLRFLQSRRAMEKIPTSRDCGTLSWSRCVCLRRYAGKKKVNVYIPMTVWNAVFFLHVLVKMLRILQLLRICGLSVSRREQQTISGAVLPRQRYLLPHSGSWGGKGVEMAETAKNKTKTLVWISLPLYTSFCFPRHLLVAFQRSVSCLLTTPWCLWAWL